MTSNRCFALKVFVVTVEVVQLMIEGIKNYLMHFSNLLIFGLLIEAVGLGC